MTPTPEDLVRDAEVDLELEGMLGEPTFPMAANLSRLMGVPQSTRDAAYIHYARPALRAWIRRAVAAEAEVARMKQWTYCAYCGFEVHMDTDGSLVAEHIRTCEKHPMREVEAEVAKLRNAIRYVRDQRGDDRCWLDLERLYALLPEGYTPPERDTLIELENCKRYIASCNDPNVEYVSPQRRIEELEQEVAKLRTINAGFTDRIAAQSDQLSQNAERSNALVLAEREACANIVCDFVKGTKDAFLGGIIAATILARGDEESTQEDRYEPCGECGIECVLSDGLCKGCEKEEQRV